ncbi:hypothetical protein OIDMADRAFT_61139 [Oidiodendron maius Zn]|uniref:Uncharacterized protein n=1 Tax=Oidiodendron maius (strain Zn) TaxID=913774 RepID=A0A0C3CVY5_OIDMZ|nr:hypothetical protein OIDMADRAFT_61139 [Oidiodendron maius Zn]
MQPYMTTEDSTELEPSDYIMQQELEDEVFGGISQSERPINSTKVDGPFAPENIPVAATDHESDVGEDHGQSSAEMALAFNLSFAAI